MLSPLRVFLPSHLQRCPSRRKISTSGHSNYRMKNVPTYCQGCSEHVICLYSFVQRPLLNLHDLCEGHGNVTENDHMQPEGPITQVPLYGNLPAASLTLFISLLPPKFPSSRSPAALTCIPSVFIHICRIALILKEER